MWEINWVSDEYLKMNRYRNFFFCPRYRDDSSQTLNFSFLTKNSQLLTHSQEHTHTHTRATVSYNMFEEAVEVWRYVRECVCVCVVAGQNGEWQNETAGSADGFLKSLYRYLFPFQSVGIASNYRTGQQARYKTLMNKKLEATLEQHSQQSTCSLVVAVCKRRVQRAVFQHRGWNFHDTKKISTRCSRGAVVLRG